MIAEWYNVSNQWDQEVDWFQTHEHLVREGYAWVGVSAQRAGVHSPTGLRAWSPERYGTLDLTDGGTVTDDTLSWDVFSQAVAAVLQWAYRENLVDRVHAYVRIDNRRSQLLLERSGFVHEGCLRSFRLCRGQAYDYYIYALLRSDWAAAQQ